MPSRFHKNRKARGHVSAGHGRIGEYTIEARAVIMQKKGRGGEQKDGDDGGVSKGSKVGGSIMVALNGV
jgi:hypothetical protein